MNPLELRGGYEFLGLLIVVQFASKISGYLGEVLKATEVDEKEDVEEKEAPTARVEVAEINLEDPKVLSYIPETSRKCTLCLEYMKSPTSTLCGHIFCWTCLSEWCREKPECPLCRQSCLEQNILPLR